MKCNWYMLATPHSYQIKSESHERTLYKKCEHQNVLIVHSLHRFNLDSPRGPRTMSSHFRTDGGALRDSDTQKESNNSIVKSTQLLQTGHSSRDNQSQEFPFVLNFAP
eukprot:6476447-Amphidinium_carterae.1